MIELYRALDICRTSFPRGPEALASSLSVEIERTPLDGCEGWCINGDENVIIRINSKSPATRQRFTLAHELAHLIVGSPPDVSPSSAGFGDADEEGEEVINNIASEMLLPERELKTRATVPPYTRHVLKSVAAAAGVAETVVAHRLVALHQDFELAGAFLAILRGDGSIKWIFPHWACSPATALRFVSLAKESAPCPYEIHQSSGTWTLLYLDNPNQPALFGQLMRADEPQSLGEPED